MSTLLDGIAPWLLSAVTCGGILLIALILLLMSSRRKCAKPGKETNWVPGPNVEPPSQKAMIEEIYYDSKKSETKMAVTYCNNGCQGACACPALDSQKTLTSNEPALTQPPPPPPEDIPPSDPLPEIPTESQSNPRRKTSKKSSLQSLKEKFVKREPLDAESKSKDRKLRRSSRIAKKSGKQRRESELDGHGSESEHRGLKITNWARRSLDGSDKQDKTGGGKKEVNKSGSNKEENIGGRNKVNKGGSLDDESESKGNDQRGNESKRSKRRSSRIGKKIGKQRGGSELDGSGSEVNKSRSNKEANKSRSNKEANKLDEIRSEHISQQQSRKDSLKLLKGIISFKKTTSSEGDTVHKAESI